MKIDSNTLELIKKKRGGEGTKVINLVKIIEKVAEEQSDDPFLIAMAEPAKAEQESFEQRQTATADALEDRTRSTGCNQGSQRRRANRRCRRQGKTRIDAQSEPRPLFTRTSPQNHHFGVP